MIVLDSTLKTLEIVLGGAVTTTQLPFVAVYVDVTTTAYTPIENDGASNDTTAVTMVASPAASTQRQIKFISIQNQDTVNATVILQYNDNGTIRRISKFTLSPDDTLLYTDGEGMRVLDNTGSLKQSSSGSSVSSITIASANGFAGSSSGGTTPILTLTTSITGLLKGNGTAISAAVAETDYVTPSGAGALSNKTGLISQWTNNSGYLTSLAGAVTNVTASGNIASSGGATPNITFTGVLPAANGGTAVNILTTALALGTASSVAGKLTLQNATNAFTQTIRGTNPAASITYDLPTTAPTAGQVLQSTAPAAGVATLSWATASSGITVGTTTITSGTSRRIPYNLAGVYQEAATDLYFETATPFAHVFAAGRTGVITGVNNTFYGYNAGKLLTSATDNTFVGYLTGSAITTGGNGNTIVGSNSGIYLTSGSNNIVVGYNSFNSSSATTGSNNVIIGASVSNYGGNESQSVLINCGRRRGVGHSVVVGYGSGSDTGYTDDYGTFVGYYAGDNSYNTLYSVSLGAFADFSGGGYAWGANSTVAIGAYAGAGLIRTAFTGILGGSNANGHINDWYFNNPTSTAPYSVTLNACGGSGTNVGGASLTLASGINTGTGAGTGTPSSLIFKTSTILASGTTSGTLVSRLTISSGAATTDLATATFTAKVINSLPQTLKAYTVATLPAGVVGDIAYVTDALAPAFLVAIAGGGAIVTPVFYNGVAWIAY